MSTKQAAVASIDSMLRQIAAAQEKRGEAHTEPGGHRGESTHPSKSIDDRTDDAEEGARSRENEEDVKEDQGSPGVDNTSPGTPGGQDSVQMNIGTQQSATGEDPSVETEAAKGGKDDPGSDHPARTDNDSLDGHKYAEQILRLTKKAEELGTALLATVASEANGELKEKAAAMAGGTKPAESEPAKKAEDAAQAGYELAGAALGEGLDKQAEAALLHDRLTETIVQAHQMAEKTAAWLNEYEAVLAKSAEEEESSEERPEEEPKGNPPAGGDGEGPAVAAEEAGQGELPAEAGGLGGGEEELLAALVGGGEEPVGDAGVPGAEGVLGDMAGQPAAGGALPAGMGGGELPAGADMGGGGEAENLPMLLAVLEQLGVSPEELEAASVAKQAECLRQPRVKEAAAKQNWQPKTAAQLRRYKAVLDYVRELTGK